MSSNSTSNESKVEEHFGEEKIQYVSSGDESDNETVVDDDEVQILTDTDSNDSTSELNIEETGVHCQTVGHSCGICYRELHVGNSVTTMCKHEFCNTCFFRWIATNATCPMCREPVDSKTNLTDEQLRREMSNVYSTYIALLEENTRLMHSNREVRIENTGIRQEYNNLKISARGLMERQIRLREQIDQTLGYNEGCVAGMISYKQKLGYEVLHQKFDHMKNNPFFQNGFRNGFNIQREKIDKIKKKLSDKIIKNHLKKTKLILRGNIMVETSESESKSPNETDDEVVEI